MKYNSQFIEMHFNIYCVGTNGNKSEESDEEKKPH